MKFKRFKKKIRKRMQKIGLIKKFNLFVFIKKKLSHSRVGPWSGTKRRPVIVGFVLVLVVVSAYFLFFSSSEVLAEWWDTNWHYRKAITITNSGSSQINTQVKILSNYNISTDVTNGKVQADLDDLRFTDINGNALDYWIEDDTAASLDVWVKISSIPTSTSTVYIYYGNANASSKSDSSVLPASCSDVNAFLGDGIYYIDTDGSGVENPFQAYCDMTTDSGGWTLLFNLDTSDSVVRHWDDTTFWLGSGITGSVSSALTSGFKSKAYSTVAIGGELMVWVHNEGSTNYGRALYDVLSPYQGNTFYNRMNEGEHILTGTRKACISCGNPPETETFIERTEAVELNQTETGTGHSSPGGSSHTYARVSTTGLSGNSHNIWGLGGDHDIICTCGHWGWYYEAQLTEGYCSIYSIGTKNAGGWQEKGYADNDNCNAGNVEMDYAIFVRESVSISVNLSVTPQSEEKGPGPVGYWSFDEGYGTTAQDRTSNNNDGTITGATWQTEDMCVSGKCLYFDGSNNYVNVGNNTSLKPTKDITIGVWVKPGSSQNDYANIIGNHYTGSAGYVIQQSTSNLNQYYFLYGNGSSWQTGGITTQLTANVWQHFVVQKEGTVVRHFLNGVQQGADGVVSGDIVHTTSEPIYIGIGYSLGSTRYFKGFIDEPKIYPYARTADQIKADYNSGKGRASTAKGAVVSFGNPQSSITNLSDGLVGYWKMDEASGNVLDASGNGNTGVVTGTPVIAGKYGNGRSFNGAGDYANAGNATSLDLDTFTASSWVKTTGTGYKMWMARGGGQYWLSHQSSSLHFCLTTSTGRKDLFTAVNYYDNKWHHVVNTYDGAYMKMYMDGVEINSFAKTGTISGLTDLLIGRYSSDYQFTGSLDEVRIYNRALSEREVKALYEWAPGPVAYWDFDEKTGSTAYDDSGNEYNLTPDGITSADVTIGKFGSAYSYDTSSVKKFYRTGTAPTIKEKLTISAWVYPRSYPDERACLLVGHTSWAYFFSLASDGSLNSYWYSTTPAGYHSSGASTVPLNTWSYLAASWDGSYARLYVNGIEKNKVAVIGDGVQPTGYYVGAEGTGRRFDGIIDDVRVYNYARTQKQILEDMLARRGGGNAAPLGYWKFDEGYGTTTGDSGIGNNDGTITGATWTNAGKLGKALSFDGDDVVTTPLYISAANDFTLSAWVNKTSDTGHNTIIGSWIPWIWKITNKAVGFTTYISSIESNVTANTNAEYNEWTHLAVRYIYSEDKVKFYNNGAPDGESILSGKLNIASNQVYVGGYPSWKFHGIIDEAKVYNYALTDEEIKQEYNQGKVSVMGAVGGDGSGSTSSAGTAEYCVPGSSDSCAPPIAEWKFEEHAGTYAYDSSGNGNTGTITGATYTSPGKYGGALDFDLGDYVNVGNDDSLDITTAITVEAWIKHATGSMDIFAYIVTKPGDKSYQLVASYNGNNQPAMRIWDSLTGYNAQSGVSVNDDEWHHVVGTYDGNDIKIYIDGVSKATTPHVGDIDSDINQAVLISRNITNTRFNGLIDQVRIYDYARTPAQVAWDYNKGKPIAHYKMDKGEGTTIYDSSGNGNNGTLTLGDLDQTSAGSVKVNANTAWYNGREGKQNYSLNFDGDDDYVNIADYPQIGSDDFSISVWFKTSVSNLAQGLVRKWVTGQKEWFLSLAATRGIYFSLSSDGSAQTWYGYEDTTRADGNWHNVVITKSGTNVNFYMDSSLASFDTTGGSVPTTVYNGTENTKIGIGPDSPYYFNGQIDEVKIFNYALTADQIKTEYNLGAARLGTGN